MAKQLYKTKKDSDYTIMQFKVPKALRLELHRRKLDYEEKGMEFNMSDFIMKLATIGMSVDIDTVEKMKG